MRRTLIAVTLLLGAACGSPTGPGSGLTVLAKGGSLQLENQSDRRTFYFIYEGEAAALINWAQCVDLDPSVCASLAPGERTVVPYSAIGGYEPGKTEAVVSGSRHGGSALSRGGSLRAERRRSSWSTFMMGC